MKLPTSTATSVSIKTTASAEPIVHRVPQGSDGWYAARAGCITASTFKYFRESARMKRASGEFQAGDYGSDARKLIGRLAIERIAKRPLQGKAYETYAMRRGHELEPDARTAHQHRSRIIVNPAGFVTTSDGRFGASADGFVEHPIEAGCEYKCLTDPDELIQILQRDDISSFMDQCQGGMWITGRKHWYFGLYCPELADCGMDLKIIDVPRDDEYIADLEHDLLLADAAVNAVVAKLKQNPLFIAHANRA